MIITLHCKPTGCRTEPFPFRRTICYCLDEAVFGSWTLVAVIARRIVRYCSMRALLNFVSSTEQAGDNRSLYIRGFEVLERLLQYSPRTSDVITVKKHRT